MEQALLPPADDRRMERLGPADFDAMRSLHARVLAALPSPDLLKPEPPAFHRLVLEGGAGVVFGIRREEEPAVLRAYGIVLSRLMPGDDTATRLGIPATERLCKFAGTSVDPADRGRRLQCRLIERRLAFAAEEGFDHAYATVAPGNWQSWRNLQRADFRLERLEIRYGHLLRYVVYRPKDARSHGPDEAVAWADYRDLDRLRALFAEGMVGVACVRGEDGIPQVGFVPRPT